MSDLGLAIFGHLARSTAVGLTAMVLVAVLSRRRGPESGATAAHAGLIGLLLAAGLSLAPWPRAWVVHCPSLPDQAHAPPIPAARRPPTPVTAQPGPARAAIRTDGSKSVRRIPVQRTDSSRSASVAASKVPASGPSPLPSRAIATRAGAVTRESLGARALSTWPQWLLAAMSVGWTVGAWRFAAGLLGLRRCAAGSEAIEDARLLTIAGELGASLGMPRTIALRESDAPGLPATFGLIRPCILLPRGWREWTEDECRVVLAHELVHIRRGDFASRLAGHLCVLVHFYHPIAHWLMARLRLEQELAADRCGLRLAGGRAKYLTTLARMALRQDACRYPGFDRSLLAFDSLFLRRIDVLHREKDFGAATDASPRRARWMTFGFLGSVAVLATALRAPLTPAADQGSPQSKEPAAESPREAAAPFDLSRVPAEAVGVVAFRPSSLAGNEAIQTLLTLARSSDALKAGFAKASGAGLTPESIEQVIYVQFKVDLETALKDDLSVLRKGALIVKTRSPIDPRAAAALFGEITGKYRGMAIHLDGDGTVIVGDAATVKQIAGQRQGAGARYAWSEAWSAVERSQVAIAFDAAYVRAMTDPLLMEAIDPMMLAGPVMPIWEGAKSMSLGLNLVGDQVEVVSLNVARTVEEAETTYQTDQALLTLVRNAARSVKRQFRRATLADRSVWQIFMFAKLADLCAGQILQQTRVERTGCSVRFAARVDIDTLLLLTPFAPDIASNAGSTVTSSDRP